MSPPIRPMIAVMLLWRLASLAQPFDDEQLTEEPRVHVVGVLGERASLPCDMTPNTTDDEVSLVLWYKDDSTTPIYSCDARRSSLSQAHHAPADWLGHRAYLRLGPPEEPAGGQAALELYPVHEEDEGLYRCRVDFRKARTRNYEVVLKVILPPNEPIITDQNGEILPSKSIIGPYNEGDRLLLVCQVEGGSPPPVVTWWRESFLLDDQYNVTSQGISRNELLLPSLGRNDLMATFTCLATNNNISFPVSASVTVDLNFRPLSVWIEGEQRPLSAGKPVTLRCLSAGSRPPAVVEWWKAGVRMNATQVNGTSALTFVPVSEDSGKQLSCRAENPLIAGSAIEDGWKLEVHYVPQLNLRLGSKLRHQHIQEGNDVFLECDIRASPWVTEIGWRFEGRDLSTSAGIIVSNQSLVLQKVSRRERGRYTCTATNAEGMGESNALNLRVRFAPQCKPGQKTVYGAARQEAVRVSCELEADPAQEVAFRWRFNASQQMLGSTNVMSDGTRSWATVVPQTDEDYGALFCWGKNGIGIQREPCIFTLIQAGPPDAVQNCSVQNQTEESVALACSESYDGGLPQRFRLELHDTARRLLRANVSAAEAPSFVARALPAGTSFVAAVYAYNSRGRSPPTVLVVSTLPAPVSLTRKEGVWQLNFSPLLATLVAVIGGLAVIAIAIVIVMKFRDRPDNDKAQKRLKKDDKCHMPLQKDTDDANDMYHDEEKCPDIIPDVRLGSTIAGPVLESSFGGATKSWEHFGPISRVSYHKNPEWGSPVREKDTILLTPLQEYSAYSENSKDKSELSVGQLTSFKPLGN
ncbi:neural cell adhesion molecule 2-like isoform X1 [Rhipicephalus microplus]|uniref:neural cell adhesion molecule 2-like isoform X1 n=1 Tax=Rhipicephalus microplus TaxID=6941 RepID=UPI003F6A5FAF